MGEFLQAQIDRHQSDDISAGRLEQLTAALDHRGWHEFGIERQQHGQWVPATGPASGGERVLAVSVPLFAAASSHYATATNPHAPPASSRSTKPSPAWTTTPGPSASVCCTPSTWTW
ncbi:SbcC/MukB-like Walker B domain-containing protein [Streptomyces sp. NPDC059441]|uniref:SbcC/MukB-like Walker B domain-containing protein n=1 Tax=Streptomyces sp. NPDC059441 TaxID=3346829 RepID=UPI0036C32689